LDERLGLSALIAQNIMDDRRGKNTQLPLPDLLRQSIYSRLAPKLCTHFDFFSGCGINRGPHRLGWFTP
jgi:hypothetical protein